MSSSASPSVSPSMEDVLPIRGIDGNTGEALPIGPAPGLREGTDPYRMEVVRWAALDLPSILSLLSEGGLHGVAFECFCKRDAPASSSDAEEDSEGICPSSDPGFPKRMESDGGEHVPVVSALFRYGNALTCVSNGVPAEEVAEEEGQRGGGRLVLFLSLVTGCPSSIKQWKESWFWVSGNWQRVVDDPEPDLDVPSVYGIASSLPRCELSTGSIDVLRSIYQADTNSRSYNFILNRQRCLVELGLIASQGKRPRPTLAALTKQRPRILVPGSAEDSSQRKVIEDLSRAGNKGGAEPSKVIEVDDAPETEVPLSRKRKARPSGPATSQAAATVVEIADPPTTTSVPPLQRTLTVNPAGEVVLEGPSKSTPTSEGETGGSYDSRRRLRELIGAPGARIPDDVLRSVPFYPSMGAQAFKKYFTPKWEEFSSHAELEDVLEASLASAIRASAMQMKVLGEFRNRMQEQKRRVAEASKADKEHQQALEGLKAALESAQIAYKEMEADLRESDSNLLNMTKQLDNANAAQKVAAEALEAANVERRRLQEEAKSRDEEISGLRKELADAEEGKKAAEDGRKEAEAGKKEVEARLANAEADFVANFHNTEAYSNFADYFARIGQQEVMTVLRNDHPDFDVKSLEAKFPPPDAEGEGDS
ncbi:putative abhydrolase domain-containing protein [Abeliophyllum distichum]|uniref:Abhydrolase domain-containing protein n=1 Tax=Abeliophyllum distichum TaxID=126358 RepID=A0ABD1SAU6_9LAMI